MDPIPFVLPFSAIDATSLPLVGGEGANLGEMTAAGFPVPGGFCVTTAAWRAFLEAAPPDVFAPLDGLTAGDLAAVRSAGATVRATLGALPIPPAVATDVTHALRALGVEHPCAVRSSATAEDLPDASFAGQQDTYLNQLGEAQVLDGVRRCWISLFTDRAILYRAERGFRHEQVQLSVVVQRMVLPEVSGILFTADPISGHRDRLSIDAGFGLGEALVSGLVSADLYRVDKLTGAILERRIADKLLRIRPLKEGGTVEEPLSDAQRHAPALSDAQITALAALAGRIERHYGRPQDVEWCIEGDTIFVVQSRPITTLFPMPEPVPRDGRLHVYISENHIQGMVDAIPPLARSMLKAIYPFGKSPEAPLDTVYMVEAGGRGYHDATEVLRLGWLRAIFPKLLEESDPLMGRALGDVAKWPEFQAEPGLAQRLYTWSWAFFRFRRLGAGLLLHALFVRPEGLIRARAAREPEVLKAVRARIDAAPVGPARMRQVGLELATLYERVRPTWFGPIFASIFGNLLLDHWFPKDADLVALLRAMPDNIVTEKDLALTDLAAVIAGNPALRAVLAAATPGDLRARLAAADPALGARLDEWLTRYGCRGPGEFDVSRPRYVDDLNPILQALRGMIAAGVSPEAIRADHAAFAAEADRALGRLVAKSPWWKRPIVRRVARVVRSLTSAREQPKHHGLQISRIAREHLAVEGARLVAAGILDAPGDIWFLRLLELAEGPGPEARARVQERKEEFRRHQHLTAPRVLTSRGERIVATHARGSAPDGALVGTSASAGVVEGIARVLEAPDQPLAKGDILVTRFTDPGWTPLFALAGGLVMEVGGQMTHGSVVAREYGIPAVVCVPDATRVIKDGDRIRVDGDRGYVEVLSGSGSSEATIPTATSVAAAATSAMPVNPAVP